MPGSNPFDGNVASSALPTGAATSENQTNGDQKTQIVTDTTEPVSSSNPLATTTFDENGLEVRHPSITAFGEQSTAESTPEVQVQFPYNINTEIVDTTITGSGTVTQADSKAVVSTGAATSSSSRLETKRILKYNTGQGGLIRFTAIFTTGVSGSNQWIGYGNSALDGFFFTYQGDTFGVARVQNGAVHFTPQSSWNVDPFDGTGPSGVTLNKQLGNVYQIRFQWLGFGAIEYYVEDPATGSLSLCHRDAYANTSTVPTIFNPSLPLSVYVENTTNDTDITVETASMAAFVEGEDGKIGVVQSASNTKTGVTTETNILTIRNKTTYASKANRVRIQPLLLTTAADGTKIVKFKAVLNATLGGTPSYTDINTNNSVTDFDTAGTTVTGGKELTSFQLGKTDSDKFFLGDLDIKLNPGETITISAQSASSTDAAASITWKELF